MFSIIALEMIGDSSVAPQLQYTKKNDPSIKVRKYAESALEELN
ncbi:ARM repeat superfamily protein [Desmospora sp. 8437]|nr:ARM repeat superfamily protein [Desmospora sp. 8437]